MKVRNLEFTPIFRPDHIPAIRISIEKERYLLVMLLPNPTFVALESLYNRTFEKVIKDFDTHFYKGKVKKSQLPDVIKFLSTNFERMVGPGIENMN